jgi:ribokinase
MIRVTVLGDLVTDVVVRPLTAIATASDTPATIVVRDGGAAGHVAAWLAAAGAAVDLVARVGDDDAGQGLAARLPEGVRGHLAVDAEAPTGSIVILVDPDGERTMLTDRGANRRLRPEDLPASAFAPGGHLHLSGYVLLDARSRPAGAAAMARARAAGMTASLSAGTTAPLLAAGPDLLLGWARQADVLFTNLAEASTLTGAALTGGASASAGAVAEALVTSGVPAVVVTDGSRGAAYADGTVVVTRPAVPAEVVDTTGAGDACCAGFLAAWLGGTEPVRALERGLDLAARAVAVPGGRP